MISLIQYSNNYVTVGTFFSVVSNLNGIKDATNGTNLISFGENSDLDDNANTIYNLSGSVITNITLGPPFEIY